MLYVAITDLYGPTGSGLTGDVVARPQTYESCEVEIPYANDARTARVTISLYDEAAAFVRPLDRLLKVWYRYQDDPPRTRLVFWGPITVPEWDTDAGTVTINAHDASLRLRHSYINYSDIGILGVATGGSQPEGLVTTDHLGFQLLLASGVEPSGSLPTLGIQNGTNTALTAPLMNNGQPRSMKVVRGDETFQKMVDLSQDPLAPDFEFEPYDGVSDAGSGTRATGVYARMHTWRKEDSGLTGSSSARIAAKGSPDKRQSVILQHGFGANNLQNLTYAPGGDRVLNYYVAVTEAHDDSHPAHRGIRQDFGSRERYGTYMGWQAAGRETVYDSTDSREFLIALASEYVAAYGTPPDFLTLATLPDRHPQAVRYIRDFYPGDTVSVQAKRGHLSIDADAFLTKITLKQADAAANTSYEIEAVPLAPGTLSDPGDSP